jgi:hypothetical protein
LTDFNEVADRWLREHRPDRYSPDDAASTAWLDEGAEALSDLVPAADVRTYLARELLQKRETLATRRANKLIRDYAEGAQLELLHWWATANEPLAIVRREVADEGDEVTIRERVALRALTPTDLLAFADEEERRADSDHKTRLLTCDGARLHANRMTTLGLWHFGQLVEADLADGGIS